MSNTESDNSTHAAQRWQQADAIRLSAQLFFGFWVCGLTLFFLMRFSFGFYFEHRDAIRALLGLQ